MKRKMFFLVAAAAMLFAGCDPFGTAETKGYITGRIWADAAMTVPYEGATLVVEVNPDSVSIPTVTTVTNANGVFLLEVPFYPSPSEEGGFTFNGAGRVGLQAYVGTASYKYASYDENPLIIHAGDTLIVWDISVTEFAGPGGN